MRITYLAAGHSIHTVRWVNALADRGHEVSLVTMNPPLPLFPVSPSVDVRILPVRGPAGYFLNAPFLRRILRANTPDLLHAHYASGYGTLSRLAAFSPTILSVWGSDVSGFPYESRRKEALIRKNLKAADFLWATSPALKRQTERFVAPKRAIRITPFGVDCEQFRPGLARPAEDQFVVGTVKGLEPAYGIDRLLRAFALLKGTPPRGMRPRLVIAGEGVLKHSLEQLARQLGISDDTEFTGPVAYERVPTLLNSFSAFVALSVNESFGVAVLEASACGLPVVVSDAGGLPEVVLDAKTGFVIPQGDPEKAFLALKRLGDDKQLASDLGNNGRRFVVDHYSWKDSVSSVEAAYDSIAKAANVAGS